MEYDSEIHQLSREFFADDPETRYPELMRKLGRPYSCLLIDRNDGFFYLYSFYSFL